jgi:hypothetical protein
MSEAAVDAAIGALPLPPEPLVLDAGCGNGEILRRNTPDTLAYAGRIRERRALPGGTDTLGFALLILQA